MTENNTTDHEIVFQRYFTHPFTLGRLRSGPAVGLLADFVKKLEKGGYARATIQHHICAADHLCRWCDTQGVRPECLDQAVLDRFIGHLPTCSCLMNVQGPRRNTRIGAQVFFRHLQSQGVVPQTPCQTPELPRVLEGFLEWSRRERCLAAPTLASYERYTSELISKLGDDPKQYDAAGLRAFALEQARHQQPHRAQKVVGVLRSFLQYLVVHGEVPASLQGAIPTPARWRCASLPRYLSPDDVERIISTCDLSTASGRRDHAMFLLLARLGLRAGEVVGLRLNDIDWKKARLRVLGKGRRESALPLPQDVGDAILAYLKDGRPVVDDDHVFLRSQPPIGPYSGGPTLSYRVERAMQRAGVSCPVRGAAHLLRHSLASELLKQGASLDSIGALFRHHGRETTAIYTKVDVELLRQVAQTWPGQEGSDDHGRH